VKASVSELVI